MIKPSEFFTQVEKWNDPHETEVNFRTAISRAYYSLFHETFEFLKKNYKDRLIDKIRVDANFINSRRTDPIVINNQKLKALDHEYIGFLQVNLHSILPRLCKDCARGKEFFSRFKDLRDYRNAADYHIDKTIDYPLTKKIFDDIIDLSSQIKQKHLR